MYIKKIVILLLAVSTIGFSQQPFAAEEVSSIARGGVLYDNWYKVLGTGRPGGRHPAWPASNRSKTGAVTHRCKSCHGWDLMGKDGAYASGSYKTGIKGLKEMQGASTAKVISIIKDSTHGYAEKMSEQNFTDLANFVTKGQIDMASFIDLKTKKVKGNLNQGEGYYNTVCAKCHGELGQAQEGMHALGKLANENPWETIQKIQNGQPDEDMPALRAFDLQASVDILAYIQTLPKN